MLKKIVAFSTGCAVASVVLLLASCGSNNNNVNSLVQTIITDSQKVCKFVPTAESVISVLAADPAIATAEAAVNAICDGVNSWSANQPAPTPGNVGAPLHKEVDFRLFLNGKSVQIQGKKL